MRSARDQEDSGTLDLGLIEKAFFIIAANVTVGTFLIYGGLGVEGARDGPAIDQVESRPLSILALFLWYPSIIASTTAAALSLVAVGLNSPRARRLIQLGAGFLGIALLTAGVVFLDYAARKTDVSARDAWGWFAATGMLALAITYAVGSWRSRRRATRDESAPASELDEPQVRDPA